MAELEVTAENKVTITGTGAATVEALVGAVVALTARGTPDHAELTVNQSMSGQRWSIVAKWEPPAPAGRTVPLPPRPVELDDPEPEVYPAPEPYVRPSFCGTCSKVMVKDGSSLSGWTHVDKLANKHPATQGRPVRDSPQA